MADPATLAIGAGLVGAGGSALSTYSQAQSVREQAKLIQAEAGADAARSRRESARVLAQRRALGAASGVDPSSGSLLLGQLDAARQAELEALTIQHRGKTQAKLIRSQIPGLYAQGLSSATSSVLGGFMKGGKI